MAMFSEALAAPARSKRLDASASAPIELFGVADVVTPVLAPVRRAGRRAAAGAMGGEPLLRRQCRCRAGRTNGEVWRFLGCDDAQHRQVIIDLRSKCE